MTGLRLIDWFRLISFNILTQLEIDFESIGRRSHRNAWIKLMSLECKQSKYFSSWSCLSMFFQINHSWLLLKRHSRRKRLMSWKRERKNLWNWKWKSGTRASFTWTRVATLSELFRMYFYSIWRSFHLRPKWKIAHNDSDLENPKPLLPPFRFVSMFSFLSFNKLVNQFQSKKRFLLLPAIYTHFVFRGYVEVHVWNIHVWATTDCVKLSLKSSALRLMSVRRAESVVMTTLPTNSKMFPLFYIFMEFSCSNLCVKPIESREQPRK